MERPIESRLVFFVNGEEVDASGEEPDMLLLDFLRRRLRLTGAKLGCGEGGCGACTVVMSAPTRWKAKLRHAPHRAINACLTPIGALAGTAITTVEGIGDLRAGVHPIQSRIAALHGSQCGFCTPGFVMSIFATLQQNEAASVRDIEDCLDGNLCRCTGYRPILDAAKSFAGDKDAWCEQVEQVLASSPDLAAGVQSEESPEGDAATFRVVDDALLQPRRVMQQPKFSLQSLRIEGKRAVWFRPTTLPEFIEIMRANPGARIVVGGSEISVEARMRQVKDKVYVCPSHVPELQDVHVHAPMPGDADAVELTGYVRIGTALPITDLIEALGSVRQEVESWQCPPLDAMRDILHWFASTPVRNMASIGGNIATASPLSDLNPLLVALGACLNLVHPTEGPRAVSAADFFVGYRRTLLRGSEGEFLATVDVPLAQRWEFVVPFKQGRRKEDDIVIAGGAFRVQLRPDDGRWSVASLGAAFSGMAAITAVADLSSLHDRPWDGDLVSAVEALLRARFQLPADVPGGMPEYRMALPPAFFLKFFVRATEALRLQLESSGAVGCLPPAPALSADVVSAGQVPGDQHRCSFGVQTFDVPELARAVAVADGSVRATPSAHGPAAAPVGTIGEEDAAGCAVPSSTAAAIIGGDPAARADEPTSGALARTSLGVAAAGVPTRPADAGAVGKPVAHASALLQATGAALFHDDEPLPPGGLEAAPVLSSVPHAVLEAVDVEPLRELAAEAGVAYGRDLAFVGAPQVSGERAFSTATEVDERAFVAVGERVTCVGQLLGLVLAPSRELARRGAALVRARYSPLPAVIGLDEALAARSFFAGTHSVLVRGDVDAVLAGCPAPHFPPYEHWATPGDGSGPRAIDGDHARSVAAETMPPCDTDYAAVLAAALASSGPAGGEQSLAAALAEWRANAEPWVASSAADATVLRRGRVLVVSGEARTGSQEHFYLEPTGATAEPVEGDEGMRITATVQDPSHTQMVVAGVLGMPAHRVLVRARRLGGGFGGRETRSVPVVAAAAVAAQYLRRPVRLVLERGADMQVMGQRHAFMGRYRVALDTASGRLLAVDVQLFCDGGCTLDLSQAVCSRAQHSLGCTYAVPALRVYAAVLRSNLPSRTAFRGFGAPQAYFVMEAAIEHLAAASGLPADELRERNIIRKGHVNGVGDVMQDDNLWRLWQQVKGSAEIEERRKAVAAFNSRNRYRKRGIVMLPTKYGLNFGPSFMNQAGVLLHLHTDGSVALHAGGVEMGQGLHTKLAQIAAHGLGVPVERVHVGDTKTDTTPNAPPTAASLGTDLWGGAVLDACDKLNARLRPLRAEMPAAPLSAIAAEAHMRRISLTATGHYRTSRVGVAYDRGVFTIMQPRADVDETPAAGYRIPPSPSATHPFNYYTSAVAACEVELDALTGDHDTLRADLALDLGNSINPALDVGQVEGAFVQGVGMFTLEECVYGDSQHPWLRPGHMLNPGPGTYKIPAALDIPADFRVALLHNTPNDKAVYSSRAVGEPPLFLGASVLLAMRRAAHEARRSGADATLSVTASGAGVAPSPSSCDLPFIPMVAPLTSARAKLLCEGRVLRQDEVCSL